MIFFPISLSLSPFTLNLHACIALWCSTRTPAYETRCIVTARRQAFPSWLHGRPSATRRFMWRRAEAARRNWDPVGRHSRLDLTLWLPQTSWQFCFTPVGFAWPSWAGHSHPALRWALRCLGGSSRCITFWSAMRILCDQGLLPPMLSSDIVLVLLVNHPQFSLLGPSWVFDSGYSFDLWKNKVLSRFDLYVSNMYLLDSVFCLVQSLEQHFSKNSPRTACLRPAWVLS